jgi:oligopeptide/dipeptide ABC transporter ATP-binding protein
MTAPLLEVRDLHVQIPTRRGVVRAVDGVSFEVPRGEALGLVGESGSGKTMTLRAIIGLLPPEARITSGQVILDGQDLVPLDEADLHRIRGRKLSMIFQEPMSALNPVMRVGHQIAEGPAVQLGYSRKRAAARALELMQRVGIPDPERRFRAYPHEFSGGMRQRVMIAMALSLSPGVLIADEPTTALDVTIQAQILKEIKQLSSESDSGVIFVTHDLGVVADIADRVLVMYAGRLVEQGTLDEIFYDPQHPYTWGLMGSVTRVDRDPPNRLPAIPGQPPSLLRVPEGCHFRPRCPHAFDPCRQVPPLQPRLTEAPGHLDRCWLTPEDKRVRREVGGRIGLAEGDVIK